LDTRWVRPRRKKRTALLVSPVARSLSKTRRLESGSRHTPSRLNTARHPWQANMKFEWRAEGTELKQTGRAATVNSGYLAGIRSNLPDDSS
jgi:hypothetical protein